MGLFSKNGCRSGQRFLQKLVVGGKEEKKMERKLLRPLRETTLASTTKSTIYDFTPNPSSLRQGPQATPAVAKKIDAVRYQVSTGMR